MLKKSLVIGTVAAALSSFAGVSNLRGEFRDGQLFLRWDEKDLPKNSRLSVWSSAEPIAKDKLDKAVKVAGMLNINSAVDWHWNIDSFLVNRSKELKSEEIYAGDVADVDKKINLRRGFIIRDNGRPISPEGGLHVHTPKAGETGKRYYAVTAHKGTGKEVIAFTATGKPIEVAIGKARPIVISGKWEKGCAAGKALVISLHGRGGGVAVNRAGRSGATHLFFADSTLAWREGIPFKFSVRNHGDYLEISLYDRVWIGRIMSAAECSDARDRVPAISTFWCGYNPDIAVSMRGPEYKFDNFTERYILYIVRWAQEFMGADVNRTYVAGGSMGGSGTIQMATRYPEVFAAAYAQVPIYSFTWKRPAAGGATSMWRLTCCTGKFTAKNPARMPDGRDLADFVNGAANINRPEVDMPPILATNGRKDRSIPWENNPGFYAAAGKARQMFSVFWNDGDHGMSRFAPPEFKKMRPVFRYRLNESFPAFSNNSDDRNYGNGHPGDGDMTGWINRGCQWQDISDTPGSYSIALAIKYPGIKYPVTSSVTIRRRQKFLPAPGSEVKVTVNGEKRTVKIDRHGLLTIDNIRFADEKFVTVTITK